MNEKGVGGRERREVALEISRCFLNGKEVTRLRVHALLRMYFSCGLCEMLRH